MIRIIQRNFEA